MPNTGSVTPPATSSPPLASTSYALPSPGAGTSAEGDPFLGAAARIPLTEEERQEGYDVELLNARPRGRYSADAASDDSLSRGEKYGAGLVPITSHPAATPGAVPPPLAPTGAAGLPAGAYGVGLGAAALGVSGAGAAERPGGVGKEYGGAMEHSSGTTAMSGKRKPWFLRPLPLGILTAFIVAVALAVGLGVGLSNRHSSTSDSDEDAVGGNSTRISRSSSSRSRSTTVSTGTVVPSSLYSSYTSDHPQSEESLSSTTSALDGEETASPTTSVLLPTSLSVPTITGLATTGNIPIPAASAATVNGTVYSAITSVDEIAAAVSATARARWARQRYWRG
ncbi:hypothetical protein JCM11251_007649 [Rhodosporidiobolus azoricus]